MWVKRPLGGSEHLISFEMLNEKIAGEVQFLETPSLKKKKVMRNAIGKLKNIGKALFSNSISVNISISSVQIKISFIILEIEEYYTDPNHCSRFFWQTAAPTTWYRNMIRNSGVSNNFEKSRCSFIFGWRSRNLVFHLCNNMIRFCIIFQVKEL